MSDDIFAHWTKESSVRDFEEKTIDGLLETDDDDFSSDADCYSLDYFYADENFHFYNELSSDDDFPLNDDLSSDNDEDYEGSFSDDKDDDENTGDSLLLLNRINDGVVEMIESECVGDHLEKLRVLLKEAKRILEDTFLYCFTYTKRPYGTDDYLLSDLQLLKYQVAYMESKLSEHNAKIEQYFKPYEEALIKLIRSYSGTIEDEETLEYLEQTKKFCLHFLEQAFLNHVEPVQKLIERYEVGLDPFNEAKKRLVAERKRQLEQEEYIDEDIVKMLEQEKDLIEFKAQMLSSELRDCPLLDNLTEKQSIQKFRFRKQHIKILARILKIKPYWKFARKVHRMNKDHETTRKRVVITVKCDPVVQLMIYLQRQAHAVPLHKLERFYGFKKTKLNNIEVAVCQHIYENFSYLLKIDNCIYTEDYRNYLYKRSLLNPKAVNANTCYLIDDAHIKICKPHRHGKFNITYNTSLGDNTVGFQVVIDLFGLFIDVGKAQPGSYNELTMFRDSNLAQRLSLLKYDDTPLRVLGDSDYCSYSNLGTDQLDCVAQESESVDESAMRIQMNQTRFRSAIKRSVELLKNVMKSSENKFRNRIFVSDIPLHFYVNCLLMNARQIWYKTPTSGVLSSILPVETYFLQWGRTGSAPLHMFQPEPSEESDSFHTDQSELDEQDLTVVLDDDSSAIDESLLRS